MWDLGSKILIGKEMWEIERPFIKFTASYFATFVRTPFCLSNICWFVQINPPSAWYSNPNKISSFFFGRINYFFKKSSEKYLGGGASFLYYYRESQNESLPKG